VPFYQAVLAFLLAFFTGFFTGNAKFFLPQELIFAVTYQEK
jgi:hypothetical protein